MLLWPEENGHVQVAICLAFLNINSFIHPIIHFIRHSFITIYINSGAIIAELVWMYLALATLTLHTRDFAVATVNRTWWAHCRILVYWKPLHIGVALFPGPSGKGPGNKANIVANIVANNQPISSLHPYCSTHTHACTHPPTHTHTHTHTNTHTHTHTCTYAHTQTLDHKVCPPA